MSLEVRRYPIGKFSPPTRVSPETLEAWIGDIERLPRDVRAHVGRLSAAELDTPYRPGGWTVRQVVHHLGDSHMNSFVRFKLALTEERPTIKAYWEARWARLPDYSVVPVPAALDFLDVLHLRWVALLRNLPPGDLEREFVHPDSGPVTLALTVGNYAWHGRHHLAQITSLAGHGQPAR